MARKGNKKHQFQKKRYSWVLWAVPCTALVAIALLVFLPQGLRSPAVKLFEEKVAVLKPVVVTEENSTAAADIEGGNKVVFLSLGSSSERARVFKGIGRDLASAWTAAENRAKEFLRDREYDLRWLKADVVDEVQEVTEEELSREIKIARQEFLRSGVAFDCEFEMALLEAELNGAKIYDYDQFSIDFEYLNKYLRKAGRPELAELPDDYMMFHCFGYFLDEDGMVYKLYDDGLDYGRREVDVVDDAYVENILEKATDFLMAQVKEDGSFIYGIYPRFDNEIENYNIVRHASTIWSLVCRYRMTQDDALKKTIECTIDYMLKYVIEKDANTAYLYEEKDDEIKLGGCGMAVVAMTEYMDATGSTKYQDVCCKLGNGILSMLDQDEGTYYHVLNGDFTPKEEFRTIYYDGEATFALCRLYTLTGDENWMNAARSAVDHFIEADYTQYKDHWIAYSMNEITKSVDDPEYYDFALKNAMVNLEEIRNRDTTYHTYLELLMATFEVYDRMQTKGITTRYLEEEFDLPVFLDTIYTRVVRQLNGFFFPEYAMYMENPQRILNTFMVRHDGYRVRIDDVQHNIGGYYLYYKNYDKLLAVGLLQ